MDEVPYWFPVATLVVGAIAGYLADYLRDSRAAARQGRERRGAFQRETLIELQDWVAKLARAAQQILHHDELEFRRSGQWGRTPVADAVDEAFRNATMNVNRYRVRVLDDDIRDAADEFTRLTAELSLSSPGQGSEDAARAAAVVGRERLPVAFQLLNDRIGVQLRELI